MELAGQADRLPGQLGPVQRRSRAGGVALVEDEVQHLEHGSEPLGPFGLRGQLNSAPLALIRCLARLIRWATVASGTRKARAISAVVSPPTARRVRATCEGWVSDGWQHSRAG